MSGQWSKNRESTDLDCTRLDAIDFTEFQSNRAIWRHGFQSIMQLVEMSFALLGVKEWGETTLN